MSLKIEALRQTGLSGISGPSGFHRKDENQYFRMKKFNTKKKIKIVKEEIKSLVKENYELEYRKNVKTDSSCLTFSNYDISNAEIKSKHFNSKLLHNRKSVR